MENNLLSINLLEFIVITCILIYTFWAAEKKYFNNFLISVINVIAKAFKNLYIKKKHMEDR